jgi:hypothetical protein
METNARLWLQDFEKRFASSTRFLRSSFASMCDTHLKWRHCRLNDLVICSQTVTLGMFRSSLNFRAEKNGTSNNYFMMALSTWSSGGLPRRGSSSIEAWPVLNSWIWRFTEAGVYASSVKHDVYHRWKLLNVSNCTCLFSMSECIPEYLILCNLQIYVNILFSIFCNIFIAPA